MSQKQDHRNHYVTALQSMPEDETVIPSETTPIGELGISLVDEEVKTLDSDEEGDEGDEPTPAELKVQFFTLITELQRKFPEYTATDFKKYLEEEMAEQLQILQDNFHKSFQDVDKTDPEYINLLIGLSSIGIEIPKDEVDEGDEGDDELQQIEELKIDDPETDV
jgi:hypothetical protein